MHFPTLQFIVTTNALRALSKKRPQHFTVSKATDDVQGFARPPDTLISEGWKEKLELKVKTPCTFTEIQVLSKPI